MKREENEMPLGFSFSLAMNEDAMKNFAGMDEMGKHSVVDQARHVHSKAEMEALVQGVAEGKVE